MLHVTKCFSSSPHLAFIQNCTCCRPDIIQTPVGLNSSCGCDDGIIICPQSIQQLPEYGVLFHRAGREKKPVFGELLLGVCAKGVIVYEVINNSRTTSLRFHWRETSKITSAVSPQTLTPHSVTQRGRYFC